MCDNAQMIFRRKVEKELAEIKQIVMKTAELVFMIERRTARKD